MYKILKKEFLANNVFLFDVVAPRIAKKTRPGQFIILRVDEEGERIPLTVADFDREKGIITIIFQVVGASTEILSRLEVGDEILDFVGPLGKASDVRENIGTVVCIGGGIGTAPIYPIARGMKETHNRVISIIGARNKDLVILENEMRKVSDELFITTDDGSLGMKGFVTDALKNIIERGEKIDVVYAIGPVIMMKNVALCTKEFHIKTIVSLNPVMVDGTGMCGGCRVKVGDETKFACVDGPEFDAHLVDFNLLSARQHMFVDEEKEANTHLCKIGLGGAC